jgi:hypothetical protein
MVENGDPPTRGMTVFGRQGSPTVTIALPFSQVDVKADDAAPLVADLATLVARLARAVPTTGLADTATAELAAIADAADALSSGANVIERGRER